MYADRRHRLGSPGEMAQHLAGTHAQGGQLGPREIAFLESQRIEANGFALHAGHPQARGRAKQAKE